MSSLMTKFKFKFLKLADEINNPVASVSKDLVPLKEIKFREHQDPIQDKLIIAPDVKHVYEKTMQVVAGARFYNQLLIFYVTVCIYMN